MQFDARDETVDPQAVRRFFEKHSAMYLCPEADNGSGKQGAVYNAVFNMHAPDAGAAGPGPLEMVCVRAGRPQVTHCDADRTTGRIVYNSSALEFPFTARGARYAMTIAAAASMAFGTHGATLAHGDLLAGPGRELAWVRESMARMEPDAVPVAVEVVCRTMVLSYLSMVEKTVLPCIADVATPTARQLNDPAALAALNSELCEIVGRMFRYSITMSVAQLRDRVSAVETTLAALTTHLTDRVMHYLDWRYNGAPLCAQGARALLAMVCCPEPAVCSWLEVDMASYKRSGDYTLTRVSVGSAGSYDLRLDDYQRGMLAVAMAELFAGCTALPLAGPDPAAACVALLVQRRVAFGVIAAQFLSRQTIVAISDATEFTTHPMAAAFSAERALAVLRAAVPLGRETVNADENSVTLNLGAPGLEAATAAIGAPSAITYVRVPHVASVALAPTHARRRFVARHNAMLAAAVPDGPAQTSCLASRWPAANFINVHVSRIGSRTIPVDAPFQLPPVEPQLAAVPCISIPPLTSPVGTTITAELPPDDDERAEEASQLVDFFANLFARHASTRQAPEPAAPEPAPEPGARVRRRAQARAPRVSTTHHTTRAVLAAIVYWYTFCQAEGPAVRMSQNMMGKFCRAIEKRLAERAGADAPRPQSARYSWSVNERSPLASICLTMAAKSLKPADVVIANTPILHAIVNTGGAGRPVLPPRP